MRCARKRPKCWPRSRPRAKPRRCRIRCAGNIAAARSATPRSRTIARPRTSSPDSTTETYAALKLTIDNWRWAGVPFYLRTGKALGVKRTEIAIKFKQAPFAMFRDTPVDRLSQNYLVISIEPTEGITLQFNTKVPGPAIDIDGVEMKFRYKDYFKAEPIDRLRDADLRLHDRRQHPVPARRQRRSRLAGGAAVPRRLEEGGRQGARRPTRPAAKAPRKRTSCSTRDGRSWRKLELTMARSNARRLIAVADAGGAGEGRRGAPDGADRRQSPAASRSASPADRARSSSIELLATDAYRSQNPVGPRALVHRRRALRAGATIRSTIWRWRARPFSTAARQRPISIRSRPTPPIPTKPPRRYERELKAFYGADSSIRPGRCSISC